MKQIRTITRRLTAAEAFDSDVNFALREGWTLVERKVLQPPSQPNTGTEYLNTMLYAELEKFTEPDECDESPNCCSIDCCDNCKHINLSITLDPCRTCGAYNNWEPKEGAETCQK